MNWLDVALLFFLEIIEATLQKGESANALIANLYALYQNSPLRFILLHISFIYVLFYALSHGIFNGWLLLLVAIKGFDLGLKLRIFKRIEQEGGFSLERFYGVPDMAVTPFMRYAGAFLYSGLFALAIA